VEALEDTLVAEGSAGEPETRNDEDQPEGENPPCAAGDQAPPTAQQPTVAGVVRHPPILPLPVAEVVGVGPERHTLEHGLRSHAPGPSR